MIVYIDSSALVAALVKNNFSLIDQYENYDFYSSQLTEVEVTRSIMKVDQGLLSRAQELLARIALVAINRRVIDTACLYGPKITLKSSDAIHVATAEWVLDENDVLITLDKQMARNAKMLGLKVISS